MTLRAALFAATLVASPLPAVASDALAPPDTPAGVVGQLLIDDAGGRSREDALATTLNQDDPYGVLTDTLLTAAGVESFSSDAAQPVQPGELSILARFVPPGDQFTPSADIPPIIPFAFLKDGACQAGYVAGFPAPDATYAVDPGTQPCSAASVEAHVLEADTAIQSELDSKPHDLPDADLERLVRAAYLAASAHATANGNYFARDGAFVPLHADVAKAVADAGFAAVVIPDTLADSLDAAKTCLADPGTELRIAVNVFGDGLSLIAVSSTRAFSYHYDPHETGEVVVSPAQDCLKVR